MGLSTLDLKIVILFSFLTSTFLLGMIPVIFIKFVLKASHANSSHEPNSHQGINDAQQRNTLSKYKRIMSFLSCFAAGVFLATCFLELLPTVQHNLLKIISKNKFFSGFPVSEFVMVMGLFLILLIEQIVLTVKERSPGEGYSLIPNENQPILQHSEYTPQPSPENEEHEHFTESYQRPHSSSLGGICDEPHISRPSSSQIDGTNLNAQIQDGRHSHASKDSDSHSHTLRHDHHDIHSTHHIPHERHSPADHSVQTHSVLRAMLLLVALSLHSIFEGITIGLLTTREQILNIFAALTLHKSILSFSLGMNLVQSQISLLSAIKSIIGFSISSPIGVLIGIAITDWSSTNAGIVHGLLQGIASGTFLYIIFFEILPKEFNCEVDRILKVFFLIFGYGTVTGIMFLSDDMKTPLCKVVNDDI